MASALGVTLVYQVLHTVALLIGHGSALATKTAIPRKEAANKPQVALVALKLFATNPPRLLTLLRSVPLALMDLYDLKCPLG